MTFFNAAADVERLKQGLLKSHDRLPQFRSFLLHGDPQAPRAVELYSQRDPKIKHQPCALFQYDAETERFELLSPRRPQRSWPANRRPETSAA